MRGTAPHTQHGIVIWGVIMPANKAVSMEIAHVVTASEPRWLAVDLRELRRAAKLQQNRIL